MKITTKNSKRHSVDNVVVRPTFTTGYQRDLEVARRVIGQRKGGSQADEGEEPKRDRGPRPAPAVTFG
jgi:hypothetical protein